MRSRVSCDSVIHKLVTKHCGSFHNILTITSNDDRPNGLRPGLIKQTRNAIYIICGFNVIIIGLTIYRRGLAAHITSSRRDDDDQQNGQSAACLTSERRRRVGIVFIRQPLLTIITIIR